MHRSVEQQVSHFAAFNEAIMERELINTIRNVVIDFGDNNLITNMPTVFQNDDFQTIPIGERILRGREMNVDVAANLPGNLLELNFISVSNMSHLC